MRGETRFGALRQKRPGSGFQRESFEEISRRKKFGELIRTEVGKEDFFKKSFAVHYPCNNAFSCFPRCPLVSVKLLCWTDISLTVMLSKTRP